MSSVVITGASGFIGRHLVSYLLEQKIDVYAITRQEKNCLSQTMETPNLHVVVGNYVAEDLRQMLPEKPLALIHLAWNGVSAEDRNSVEKQSSNILFCLKAVELAEEIHAEKFILPGSTMEYAYAEQAINEKALPTPMNLYGASKLSARYMCHLACRKKGIPFIYAVITGIYGPDRHDGVINYTIEELLHGRVPRYTKLEQKWDYVHIDDVVRAFYCIIQRGKPDTFYTIGHGDNCKLSEYIYIIRDRIDPAVPLEIGAIPYQSAKLPASCVDLTAIERDTGFAPSISFEEGIDEVISKIREDM